MANPIRTGIVMGAIVVAASAGIAMRRSEAPSKAPDPAWKTRVGTGDLLPKFAVSDGEGASVSWKSLRGEAPLLCLIFTHPDCPCAINCAQSLAPVLAGGPADLRTIGIMSQDTRDTETLHQVASLIADGTIPYPVYFDHDQGVRRMLGATRTPEAWLVDRSGRVLYHGASENTLFAGAPGHRALLVEAIEAARLGRSIDPGEWAPIGCPIDDPAN